MQQTLLDGHWEDSRDAPAREHMLRWHREHIEHAYAAATRGGATDALVLVMDVRDEGLALFAEALTGRPRKEIRRSAGALEQRGLVPGLIVAVPHSVARWVLLWANPISRKRLAACCPAGHFSAVAVNATGSTVAFLPEP